MRGCAVAGAESLADLLGGRRAALDASVPPLAFVVGWLAGGRSIGIGALVAVVAAVAVSAWRLRRGDKPRAVLVGLLGVTVAALIALRTGRADLTETVSFIGAAPGPTRGSRQIPPLGPLASLP